MERLDICSDCIHYDVCEDAYNYRSKCINYLSENDVIIATHETKPRCGKCAYELYCSKDNERKCPDYKRDAPDGGYYG